MALVRRARPLAFAFALAALAFGALVVALPSPQPGDRLAVSVVRRLIGSRIGSSVVRINGTTLHASCRPYRHGVAVVSFDNGDRLRLHRTRVVATQAQPRGRTLQDLLPAARLAAEADLAGTHVLYAEELIGRLIRGSRVVEGTATLAGRPVYRLRLGQTRPRVVLLVDQRTLKPVGARFRSARITGSSRLVTRPGGC